MKKLLILLLLAGPLGAAGQRQGKVVDLAALQDRIAAKEDHVKVINFWATWCAPCVKEMHLFEKLGQQRPDVKVTFVSLDLDLDPDPEKVNRFINRKEIDSEVLILKAADPNSWIDKIEKSWSGAIPATLIIDGRTGRRKFIERELHEGELEALIDEVSS